MLLWLIETDVFQIPQLHKHFNEKFDAAFVKEWYYGVFKKSNEWKGSGGKQLPYWPKGVYKKVGNLEIVEFPLMKKSKDISIPADGLEDYNKIRIAEASLQRIAFIRDKRGTSM